MQFARHKYINKESIRYNKILTTRRYLFLLCTGVVIIGTTVYTLKNPQSLMKFGKNIFKVVGGSATKSMGKKAAKSTGKKVFKTVRKFIGDTADTAVAVSSIKSVVSDFTAKQKDKDSAKSDTPNALEYAFQLNRQQVIYDIENAKENSALLEAYKRKVCATKNLQ